MILNILLTYTTKNLAPHTKKTQKTTTQNSPALPGGLVHGGDELMDEAVHLELRVIRTVRLVGVVEKYVRWQRGTNTYKCSQFSNRNHKIFVLIIEHFCLYLFQCIDLKLVCAVKKYVCWRGGFVSDGKHSKYILLKKSLHFKQFIYQFYIVKKC